MTLCSIRTCEQGEIGFQIWGFSSPVQILASLEVISRTRLEYTYRAQCGPHSVFVMPLFLAFVISICIYY